MSAAMGPVTLIVIGVFVLTMIGVAFGLQTRSGSGINEHPGLDPVPDVAARSDDRAQDEDAAPGRLRVAEIAPGPPR